MTSFLEFFKNLSYSFNTFSRKIILMESLILYACYDRHFFYSEYIFRVKTKQNFYLTSGFKIFFHKLSNKRKNVLNYH